MHLHITQQPSNQVGNGELGHNEKRDKLCFYLRYQRLGLGVIKQSEVRGKRGRVEKGGANHVVEHTFFRNEDRLQVIHDE